MKKKNIIAAFVLVLGVSLNSCDLDTEPSNAVSNTLVFNNAVNAEKVLNGAWSYLMDTYFTYQNPGWSSLLLTSDAISNDVAIQPGKYGYISHYQLTNITATNSTTARAIWTLAYKTIDNTNHLISRIDEIAGDETLKKQVKAQAYALRGYIYLNLVTFYAHAYSLTPDALCVPVYTKPSTSATEGVSRSSVKDVYQQAEDDLLSAYELIGDYKRDSKHKIDKSVISALLARLYLQKNNWEEAERYAEEASSVYSWMSDVQYLDGFNDINNTEWIWGHGQQPDQSTASYSFHFKAVSSPAAYYYSFMADPHFKEYFDKEDIRFSLFEWDTQRYKGGLMYKKFRFRSDNTADIVLIRKAEMVLIQAEALAEQNKLAEAIGLLNELRRHRNAIQKELDSFSKDALVEEILLERRKELWGEGFGLYDIKRRQKSLERKAVLQDELVPGTDIPVKGHTVTRFPDGTDFAANSSYYLFAIPELEQRSNPAL